METWWVLALMHCASVVNHSAPAVPLNFWNIRRCHGDRRTRPLDILAPRLHRTPFLPHLTSPVYRRRYCTRERIIIRRWPAGAARTPPLSARDALTVAAANATAARSNLRSRWIWNTARPRACTMNGCAWLFMTKGGGPGLSSTRSTTPGQNWNSMPVLRALLSSYLFDNVPALYSSVTAPAS